MTARIGKRTVVRVIARQRLREFWELPGRADSAGPLKAWLAEASAANWRSPSDILKHYPDASIPAENRVAFGVGSKHTLLIQVNFEIGFVVVRFLGTHSEYNSVDPVTVGGGG